MCREGQLFIHMGYRKTATTWLQEHLFNGHPQIRYLGKNENEYSDWLLDWHYLDDFAYISARERIKTDLENRLDPDDINVISSEAFSNTGVIYQQAFRIRDIAPYARIIVTLRDPVEMALSHYRNDIMNGDAVCGIRHYLDWDRRPFVIGKRRSIYLPDFFFDEVVDLYEQLFGEDNLLVLKFEEMVVSPTDFFTSLGHFMGIDIPEGLPVDAKENASRGYPSFCARRADLIREHLANCVDIPEALPDLSALESCFNENPVEEEIVAELKDYFSGRCWGYY